MYNKNNSNSIIVFQVLAGKSYNDIIVYDNVPGLAYDVYDKKTNTEICSIPKVKFITYVADLEGFLKYRSLPKNSVIPKDVKLPKVMNQLESNYARVK